MKKNIILWMGAVLMLAVGMGSCSKDDEETIEPANFHVRNFANSGCKMSLDAREMTRTTYAIDECIEYKAMKGGYLSIKHVNAVFNCEPGELKMQATLEGNVIKILETEEQSLANCICPYDLYCEVGPLSEGNYNIVIYKGSYQEGGEYANFNISYKSGLDGKFGFQHPSTD